MSAVPVPLVGRWNFADPARLEPLKWLAVVAMVCDHLAVALLPSHQWLRQIGTFAFPVFFLAFGIGLAATSDPFRVAIRLLLPAAVAEVAWQVIDPGHAVNVLFVCSGAAFALWSWRTGRLFDRAVTVLVVVAGLKFGVEGGVLGLALLAGAFLAARDAHWWSDGLLILSIALWGLLVPSVGFFLGCAAVLAMPRLSFVFPRISGLLSWVYAQHLVLLAALKAVL